MKRSPLTRRTPLARGKSELKRSPMPRKSPKMRKLESKHRAERLAYWKGKTCECCGENRATQTHEIRPGANRLIAFKDRRFWLATCWWCNCFVLTGMKLDRQLALKKLADPEFYDREFVLLETGLAVTAVTEAEVDAWITRGPRAA